MVKTQWQRIFLGEKSFLFARKVESVRAANGGSLFVI